MEYGLLIYIITVVFFAGLGIWFARQKRWSVEQFISSKNSLKVGASIATIFASGMGAWLLFGPAETLLTSGIVALSGYALASALSLWIFMWLGVKIRALMPKGHTLTEYVLHRFGKWMYLFVLIVTILFMGLGMTAELTGISLAGQVVFDIPLGVSAVIIGVGVLFYVMLGGFKASVFTDKVQTWFILPLFAILAVGLMYVGGNVLTGAPLRAPELFNIGNGWALGITLIIAIVSAELFNQSWWQRVFAAKNKSVMKKAYGWAGLLVLPVVFIAGLFGLWALGSPAAQQPSAALFWILLAMPQWLLILGMILAVALVMSSIDTALNAMISVFTVDFARMKPRWKSEKLLNAGKIVVLILAIIGITIATQGFSVLYLFLLADLVTVAIVFPVFYGLFQAKLDGHTALIASIIGLLGGFVFFPDPNYATSLLGSLINPSIPGNLLYSFLAALIIPALLCIWLAKGRSFDFKRLKKKVKAIN
ncbi:hypothetical protein GOV09_04690 [Candidatus Woesearchaeota archaeon]|nr:hypothetical protein [Candidatus Woesearchaeota archaeon]